nr:glycoside hydrolase family 38 C-terminal domain-containing protein [Candidatus Sigynarchaeota archaeon]
MKKPINAFIVSHSHWDREWYLPFALMRNKLVILMDYLLDILATEPTFHKFVTDCQVSMLDDYLAVKPGARDCVKAALSKGQILAGPYYVPPNEWLINGEAYIRNLLLARRVLRDLGLPAPSCKAGYSPDSACSDFGHPLQVPQIWALSGLPLFVGRFAARGSDFWWEAPDGSRVHVCKLMAGYSNAADLSEDIDKGSKALIKAASEVAPRYLTPNILLFNGNDHLLPQKHIGHLIERANAVQDDFSFVQGSYEEYAKAVENATHGNMPVCSGEFMEGGSRENEGKMRKVNGYFSTRIYLKQANARCEQVLASYAEPFSALAWIVGGHEYPAAYLWEAWNWVVRNHHHDSVPGTSTDAVHRECMMRYTWAEQMGTGIAVKKLNELANHIKDIPPGLVEDNDRENAFLIAFNPHPWAYRGPVTFDLMDNWLYCAEPSVRLVPLCYAMTQVAPPAFFITDATGKQYPVSIEPILNDTGYKFNQGVKNALLSFVTELPPFGYKIFELHATEEPIHPPELALKVDPATNTMENDALKITVAANGTITLVDKRSGREFPGLLEVVDYGDRGDEYDQAPVRDPACNGGWSRVSSLDSAPEITWVETGSPRGRVDIKHVFKLPLRFPEANRVDHGTLENFPVMVSVRLFEQASRADVVIIMENNSKNHRVEARVPTGIPADHMQVDGAFCTATRTANFYQTAAMHRFIDVNDGKGGIAVLSRGLYEYNLDRKDDRTLIVDLTLLRCIGVLASHEIGNRWPANSVPEAQVLGPTIVEFALAGHTSDAVAGNVHRLAAEFCAPPRTIEPLEHLYLRGKCPKTLPAGEHSFLELSPSQLEFSAL